MTFSPSAPNVFFSSSPSSSAYNSFTDNLPSPSISSSANVAAKPHGSKACLSSSPMSS